VLHEARYDFRLAFDRLLSRSPAAELARRRVEVRAELRRAQAGLEQALRLARVQLRGRVLQLAALSPERTLGRGYAVCSVASGAVLRSIQQVELGDPVDIRIADGLIAGRAVDLRPANSAVSPPDGHGEEDEVRIADV